MCIRDRDFAAKHNIITMDESVDKSLCYSSFSIIPVSYTHLDVYKRQPLYRQPPHVVQSRYGIVGLAVGNGGFYVKTDQPTTNYRPLPKTFP